MSGTKHSELAVGMIDAAENSDLHDEELLRAQTSSSCPANGLRIALSPPS
jgi:hypothetical protein